MHGMICKTVLDSITVTRHLHEVPVVYHHVHVSTCCPANGVLQVAANRSR